ncbi:MAG TPA: asparagine synthase (glutamine-hydrolyzing) [Bryobacteraceae bacterium]|nr:asparagine synthase (glutamine-hydrolyzing) [Bryobacteraceae bacterium]
MCGIAGFYLRNRKAEPGLVRTMCGQIRHRGPDDEGYHIEGGCAIGMRRLSIIDLSTGHQPICNEDGSVWVVFNGEIYNYQQLRRDLVAGGHRFQTNSDTETLVHLYEEEGAAGLERLRGMFAFAVWDAARQRIFLARDRFGKKPLYYAVLPEGLYFGSELKCLRAAGVPDEIDAEALRLYFQFTFIPEPFSCFKAVRKLAPGSWLTYDAGGTVDHGRYWRFPVPVAQTPPDFSESDVCEQLRVKFDESVRIRMIADVPLGAFLSGGIDSSSVVASMALASPAPVRTFSIGFEESAFNELEYAALAARQYRTDHHEIVVRPDAIDLVTRLVHHFDEPFGDSSAIPTFIVSEFAVQHVKVALSGDGGDELFAGYDRFQALERVRRFDRIPQAFRSFVSWTADRLPYSVYGKNYLHMLSRPTALERYFESNFAPRLLRKELLEPDWILPTESAYLTRTFADFLLPADADLLSQALYFETTQYLPADMLTKVDRMSMANSLEVRCPMLDHELAALAASIPHAWKIRDRKGKYILLRALGSRLPPALVTRPKMGFAVPLSSWFRNTLRAFLWDHLTSATFIDRGIATPAFVRHLLLEHDALRRDNSHWLWSLLMLELWFQQIDRPVSAAHAYD